MVLADGSLLFDTKLDSSGIKRGIASIGSITAKAMDGVTAGLAAGTAASVKFGSQFETSFAKASTLFGDVTVDVDNLKNKILEMSNSSGVAAIELNETLYQAMSAGIPVTEDMGIALEAVSVANKLAVGGYTSSATAMSSLTTAINAYGLNASDASQIADQFITVQNKGVTTVDELASNMGKAISTGSAYSVNLENLNATYISLTKAGINTAESTTYLSSMMNELGDNGSNVGKVLQEKTGMSFSELMNSGSNLADIMDILSESVEGDSSALMNLWGSAEAGKAANAILSQGTDAFRKSLDDLANSTGITEDAYNTMMNTFDGKKGILIEGAKNLSISIYEGIKEQSKGMLDVASEYIEQLKNGFEKNGVEGLVSAMGAILADLISRGAEYAPLMIELAIQLINAFVQGIYDNLPQIISAARDIAIAIVDGIGDLCPAVQPLTDLLAILINHLDTILSIAVPLTAAFLGLKAGMAIQAVVQGFQQAQIALALFSMETNGASIAQGILNGQLGIGEAVAALFTGQMTLAELASAGLAKAQGVLNAVMAANPIALVVMAIVALIAIFIVLWNKCDWFREFWINLWENIKSFCVNPVDAIVIFFTESIPNALSSVVAWIQSNWQSILLFLINPFAGLFSYFYNNNQKFHEFVDNAVNAIKELPGKIGQFLLDVITKVVVWHINLTQKAVQAGTQFVENIIMFIKELPGKMWGFLLSAVTQIVIWRSNLTNKGKEAAKGLFDAVINGIKDLPSKILDIGNNLVEGLWNGINDKVSWITNKIKGFGSSVLNAMKNIFDIHSPSKKFAWIGKMCIEGFDQEFDDFDPYDSMNTAMKANKATLSMSYRAGIEKEFGTSGAFDYYRLAKTMVDAFGNSGMTVTLDGRTTGRLIGRYL